MSLFVYATSFLWFGHWEQLITSCNVSGFLYWCHYLDLSWSYQFHGHSCGSTLDHCRCLVSFVSGALDWSVILTLCFSFLPAGSSYGDTLQLEVCFLPLSDLSFLWSLSLSNSGCKCCPWYRRSPRCTHHLGTQSRGWAIRRHRCFDQYPGYHHRYHLLWTILHRFFSRYVSCFSLFFVCHLNWRIRFGSDHFESCWVPCGTSSSSRACS